MRSKKLDETLMILAVVGAVGVGCGGDVKSPSDRAPPKADASAGEEPEWRDAGTEVGDDGTPATPGAPSTPTTPAPEGRAGGDDDRPISALTEEELKVLCEDGRKQVARALMLQSEVRCTSSALALAKTADECKEARSMCIAQLGAAPTLLTAETCESDALVLAEDCADLSVADIRACTEAWTAQLALAATKVDCSMTGTPVKPPMLADPAECQNIDARCVQ